jgi:iron complex transport system ATP-binding protein
VLVLMNTNARRCVDVQPAAAMIACGVYDLRERPIFALSGGELRRVFIARALAQQADVLLLDEPTTGLDLHHQVAIFELLRREAAAGRCVVLVGHDLTQAGQYCDRLTLLAGGRVLATGSPLEVLTPEHVRTAYSVDVVVGQDPVAGRYLLPGRRT